MSDAGKCPLCDLNGIVVKRGGAADEIYYSCKRCGHFIFSHMLATTFEQSKKEKIGYVLSGLVREIEETGGDQPSFTTTNIDDYLSSALVPELDSIEEKAEKLLTRILKSTKHYGEAISLHYTESVSLAYAKNVEEFIALTKLLDESGLIEIKSKTSARFSLTVTAAGWKLFRKMSADDADSKQVFIAVWDSDKMADAVQAIEKAIKDLNLEPICVNNGLYSDKIMDKALSEIKRSKAIVVDLTGARDSVFLRLVMHMHLVKMQFM